MRTGYSSAPPVQAQLSRTSRSTWNVYPGSVFPPAIFEPPASVAANEVWIGICGGPYWGSAEVYISSSGDSYGLIGSISKAATMGYLTGTLPVGGAVDTAHGLSVDLSQSRPREGLVSISHSDAAALANLCWVADDSPCALGELISFQRATLTGSYAYDLSTLYRGAWGSTVREHAAGKRFLRVDGAVAKFSYDPALVGQTVNFKFLSSNFVGGRAQSLADVTAYPYTLTGGTELAFPVPLAFQFSADKPAGSEAVQAIVPYGLALQPDFGTDAGAISFGRCRAPATADAVFSIQKATTAAPNVWVEIGKATYAAGDDAPTFASTSGAAQSLDPGETVQAVAPASQDATLAGVLFVLAAHRS